MILIVTLMKVIIYDSDSDQEEDMKCDTSSDICNDFIFCTPESDIRGATLEFFRAVITAIDSILYLKLNYLFLSSDPESIARLMI